MLKAFKYRLYPNKDQEIYFSKCFGCCRWVWNRMLADEQTNYEETGEFKINTPATYKEEFPWLKEVDSLALTNTQLNLKTAFSNFFKSAKNKDGKFGFPKWKCKHDHHDSYTTNNQGGNIWVSDKYIKLPKIQPVRIKQHRQIPYNGVIKSVTISRTPTMKYYISILVDFEYNIPKRQLNLETSIGLDFSMPAFYVDNQGNECGYPKFYRKAERKIKRENRRLSRKQKGSKNREKQRIRLARAYEKSANQRNDWLNKLSFELASKYDYVFVEDIDMKSMSKALNFGKSVMDLGFGMFRTMLNYKLQDNGGYGVYKISKWFPSSKTCRFCGVVNKDLSLKDRVWTCPSCGETIYRDVNAAINIRNKGIADLS